MYEYSYALASLFSLFIIFIIALFGIGLIDRSLFGSKSHKYRKLLTNMYVVGKLKQIAKKDNVDLIMELKDYSKTILNKKEFDDKIEEQLVEELEDKVKKSN